MIGLIGIRRNIPIQIREAFTIKKSEKDDIFKELLKYFKEVVVLTTCNRTEIYINHTLREDEVKKIIFNILGWKEELKDFIFYVEEKKAYKHLFELSCGYHSRILGEDQILGQIKDSYSYSLSMDGCNGELSRLFQEAISCGKKFRTEAKLFEIPVSTVSVVVSKAIKEMCRNIMVIGYGEIGSLAIKYLLSHKVENIYLVVRNPESIEGFLEENINIISFKDKNEFINRVDCIISCTNAPHPVVLKGDIGERKVPLYVFDMAVPRDVEVEVGLQENINVYNIDEISEVDDENKQLRSLRMKEYKYILDKYIVEYEKWINLRDISPIINDIKINGKKVYEKRLRTYIHKTKDSKDEELVEILLKSTSDAYVNRAIEVLKDEKLRGCEEECLRIIRKIFLTKD